MTPDWRALIRAHVPTLDLEHDREIVDELAEHLADIHEEAIAQGRSPEDALAAAVAALPAEHERLARELLAARTSLPGLIADRWTAAALDAPPGRTPRQSLTADLRRDVVYAVRALRHSPGYTAVMLLILALGIGANSAIFAAVDTVLLRPMPYPGAERLVVPVSVHVARDIDNASVSYADYADWQRETDIFEAVALWRPMTVDLTGAGRPERIRALQVSAEYFRVLPMTPLYGRLLVPADHDAKATRVCVLSHGLWQRTLGGAPDVVGKTIRIGGTPHEIAGVLPSRIVWPEEAELFIPMRPTTFGQDVLTRRDNLIFLSVARLRDAALFERGNAALAAIATRLERDFPESRKGWTNRLTPIRDFMVESDVRRGLWVLLAAVAAVLLIGCANLAHLGLVRGLGRARELSVRVALGASRWRLVRQLAVECLLVAVVGAALGAGLAMWMIEGLKTMAPEGTPFISELALDVRVLGATAALTIVAVLLAGLLPALTTSRVQPAPALKDGSLGAGSSRRVRLLRQGLVVTEVAGAVVLLAGAALLLRSFWRLQQVDPGLDVDRVIAARLTLPQASRYETSAQSAAFFQRLIERLTVAPGIESAGATSFVPIGGGGFGLGRVFLAEGRPEPPAAPDVSAQWNVVTPEYFRTVGIPVLEGRTFSADDREKSTPVAVVSRSFATRMFGTETALGKRVRSWRDENLLREIVGVVDEVRYTGLGEREILRQFYVPHTQNSWGLMNVVVRAKGGDPAALESVLRREVGAIDPELAVSNVATLRTIARDSIARARYTTLLLSLLASAALALGAVGLYGVISHAVSMRRRELGVRAALGASPRDLHGLVFREGVRLTAIGLVLGLACALAVTRMLGALLYDTPPRDPVAFVATIVTLGVAAGLACFGPARRAAKANPLIALRNQ
jgi:putative ABC transport system permease protein